MKGRRIRIGVIGAGISGMSCAYRLQTELANVKVTVVSEDLTPNLTSDGAAGIWEVYDFFHTEPAKIIKWSMDTYGYLKQLGLSSESNNAGVSMITLVNITNEKLEMPRYAPNLEHLRRLTKEEIDSFGSVDGYSYTTAICEPRSYLPWLYNKYILAGGEMLTGTVVDLSQFCERYDLVINCAGLMASKLTGDKSLYPCRGQVIKVKGVNLIYAVVNMNTQMHYIPGRDWITLGGTFTDDDYNTEIDDKQKELIWESCCELHPSIKNSTIVMDWCGLRPARREGVRLEVDASFHPTTKVIHNYGHGGIGITVHWGCAADVLLLARQSLSINSKL